MNFRKPIYVTESKVSLIEKPILEYPSLLKPNTAFGPTSLSPFINRVRCTPKNGYSGSGTGYIR
jgi:hypothetical protein